MKKDREAFLQRMSLERQVAMLERENKILRGSVANYRQAVGNERKHVARRNEQIQRLKDVASLLRDHAKKFDAPLLPSVERAYQKAMKIYYHPPKKTRYNHNKPETILEPSHARY